MTSTSFGLVVSMIVPRDRSSFWTTVWSNVLVTV